MSLAFRTIVLVVLVTGASFAEAATITWKNPAGGDWATPANWNPSTVPGPADTATIALSGTYTVTLTSAAQVASLNLGGSSGVQTLANAGATLTLNGASTISTHGTYSQTAGTLTVGEPLSVSGVLNWSGGILGGSGGISITTKGKLNVGGNALKYLLNSVDNGGEVVWSGTGDVQTGGVAFNNLAGGRFTIENDQTWSFGLGGVSSQFNNQAGAMVTKSGGSGVTTFSGGPFNNLGTVTISSGILALTAGGTSAGSFNVASGARLDFPGGTHALDAGAAFTGGGVVGLTDPATLTLAADVAAVNLDVAGGTLDGPGNLTVTGTLQWTSGTLRGAGMTTIATGAALGIDGSSAKNLQRTINNAGAATWNSTGDVLCGAGVAFNNQAGGTFAIQNDQTWSFNASGTPPQFNNLAGSTLTKGAGSGTTTFSNVPLNNNGTVHAGSGVVALAGGGAGAGPFTVASAGRVDFSAGTYTLGSGAMISGAGAARVTGMAELTLAANVTAANLEVNGGTLDGAGNLTISGALNWFAGTMSGTGVATIAPGATLSLTGNLPKNLQRTINNMGSVTWSGSGSVLSGQGAVFNNQAGGTFTSQNSQTWSFNSGTQSQFNNQPGGTVNKSDSGTTAFSNVPFNNSGTVNVSNGVLQLAGGGESGGPFAVASGAHLEFGRATHTLQSGAAFTGAGTVSVPFPGTLSLATNVSAVHLNLNGGTLDGAGVLTVAGSLEWTDGTMTGSGATSIAPGGSFHIGGSSLKILERRVNNAGNATWDGSGDILSGQGAVFTNQAGASLTIASDQTWFFDSDGTQTQFDNQAGSAITKSGGGGTTTFSDLAFTNRGTITAAAGTLNFHPGFYQSAGVTRLAGGSLLSSGTFNLQGGVLDGTGTLTGSVLNAAQVKPGTSPGKITIGGPYSQTTSGSFAVELNGLAPGAEFDQLAVIGAVTVGGTLQVSLGFAPPYGATFLIIDNDGSDAVIGAFTGLPEGATLQVGNTALSISYAGGDGNDVVLIVPTPTPTSTPTPSRTSTQTPTRTPTSTTTPTRTPTQSPAPTATVTAVQTAAATGSPTLTARPTAMPSSTPTRTVTGVPTGTQTQAATRTPTPSLSRTASPTVTASATPTRAPSSTVTQSPTVRPTSTATPLPPSCVGDCNADGTVTVNELIVGVNLFLGEVPLGACPAFDVNRDGVVLVNEVVAGVNSALGPCG